ncbi:WD repeat domain 31 [Trypanosoma grayi]|uniref:WD repeat domain 31 n=1 Tax=Trypanosoma grayi TaxID=71804 RepID=UPI0004F44A4B|nr:WD repeat domain 31 [Trypanosoma grayi]KEG14510.1 WD repeat domain 31 [Trypanosoma grayi]
MGQSCFRTHDVHEKSSPREHHTTSASRREIKLATGGVELSEISKVDSQTRPTGTFTEATTVRCHPYLKGDAVENPEVLNLLSVQPKSMSPKYRGFPGIFRNGTAALSLRSCEEANMPHHFIVGGEDGNIVLVDYESGETVRRWSGAHGRDVNCLTKPLHSGIFASASRDKLVKVWNLQGDQPLCELQGHTVNVTSATLNLDGTFLVSGSRDNTVRLWNVERAEEMECCDVKQNIVHFVQWVPRLHCVAQGGEDLTLRLWDMRMSLCGDEIVGLRLSSTLSCMDYHPICCELMPNASGCTLLTGHNGFNGYGAYIVEWDLRMQKRVRTVYGHKGTVRSISRCILPETSSCQQQFVSGDDDGALAFFSTDPSTGETDVNIEPRNICTLPEGGVTSLDAYTGGDVLASTRDGTVIVFSPRSRKAGLMVPMEPFRYFGSEGLSQ